MPILVFLSSENEDFDLYYTIHSSEGTLESDPTLSLGGLVSVTEVSNEINNIFEEFNLIELSSEQEKRTYKCIIFKPKVDLYNVKFYIKDEVDGNYASVNFGIEDINPQNPIEIPDKYTKPDDSNFDFSFSHYLSGNPVTYSEILSGDNVYIWLERIMSSASNYNDIDEGSIEVIYEKI